MLSCGNSIDMKDLLEFRSSSLSSSWCSSSSPRSSLDTGAEQWDAADKEAHKILSLVQPNVNSERKRKEIIEYIQVLIGRSYGIKVFPFGSVPLKTYLPDGDIDLTVVCHHVDDELVLSGLCALLKTEQVTNSRFQVRDVQCIPAQVKVVKCCVENIPVDISFNQMAGLCALTFLEQVDQLFGKDHLLKRGVILIKSWCFYESRILGAHYGLISTYGLETMAVHIINLFHSTLSSPLAVLHKFLTYYSKFDWDNHCVAINGVMLISSLPNTVVELPEGCDEPLLSAEFLQKCKESYFISTGVNQTGQDQFTAKFLNMMDPLSNTNNLGRSVNKANFSRIKLALSYASEQLEAVFAQSPEKTSEGIAHFFRTTLEHNRPRSNQSDVALPVREPSDERSEASGTSDENESLLGGIQYGLWCHDYGMYEGDGDPMSPQNFSQVGKVATTNGEMFKSRGTGTYIPQPVHTRQWHFAQSRRKPDSPPLEPKPEEDAELPSVAISNNFSSPMEFPLLPGAKPVEMSNVNPPNLHSTDSSMEATESETTQTPKQLDSEWVPTVSTISLELTPCPDLPLSVKEANEKEQEPTENGAKRALVEDTDKSPELPQLCLGDPNEFPDLPLLRLRDPTDFPELPTLRLRDPKVFPPLPRKQQKGVGRKGRKKN